MRAFRTPAQRDATARPSAFNQKFTALANVGSEDLRVVVTAAVLPGKQPPEAVPKYGYATHAGKLKPVARLANGPMRP